MPITYDPTSRIFKLDTPRSSYILQVSPAGHLFHLYYGGTVSDADLSYRYASNRFYRAPEGESAGNDGFSLETMPQEYPCANTGDYRAAALCLCSPSGHVGADLRYVSHQITQGKPALQGLPATYVNAPEEADTLSITLRDAAAGAQVTLLYTVFRGLNILTRSARIENTGGKGGLTIERAMSSSVDFDHPDYDLIQLSGAWGRECAQSRARLHPGEQGFGSRRGISSHQHNPFFALVSPDANETAGECFGFHLVYSGNFLCQVELSQYDSPRALLGIHPETFSWLLQPGESFTTPEAVMVYSGGGLGELSRTLHTLYRENLCRGVWKQKRRPILLNSWEAVYFDFDEQKLLRIAKEAAALGVELLVMDDGWFGRRNDDKSSLGDWYVNTEKLKGGLKPLVEQVNALGLQFGIWVEPEMISPDSDLYREHPDWCLHIPGRPRTLGRNQLVLDMTRQEIRDYLFETIGDVLQNANIAYVKWDMNRSLSEAGSAALDGERQKETFHRYVLGVYELMERFVTAFPNILFEGCAGGGGRFDPGILYYFPQIWTSDDTDAAERARIQWGASLCYPVSAMGSHVSACPNHQTGRTSPFETRGRMAMAGAFGYELDPGRLTAQEKEAMRGQIQEQKALCELICRGEQYRLLSPFEDSERASWGFMTKDAKEILLFYMQIRRHPNPPHGFLRFPAADPAKAYRDSETGRVYRGDTLAHAGLPIPETLRDGESCLWHLTAE